MLKKIILFIILAGIVYGGWRVVQNANYATEKHSNVDRGIRTFNNLSSF